MLDIADKAAVKRNYQQRDYALALGIFLCSWRLNALITQEEAAAVFGVHRTTYAAWEAGTVEIRASALLRLLNLGGFERWQLGLAELPPIYQRREPADTQKDPRGLFLPLGVAGIALDTQPDPNGLHE